MKKKERVSEKEVEAYLIEKQFMHYRLAYSYVRNQEDALDIIQEASYKAIVHIDSLKSIHQIKPWFCRILINTALDFLRKRKRLLVMDEETMAAFDNGSEDRYEDIDLQQALREMPDQYRSILILRFFEDLKIEEIADILNENINTVKSRLYRSLKMLRLEIKKNQEVI